MKAAETSYSAVAAICSENIGKSANLKTMTFACCSSSFLFISMAVTHMAVHMEAEFW
jgi:hypothetical protein